MTRRTVQNRTLCIRRFHSVHTISPKATAMDVKGFLKMSERRPVQGHPAINQQYERVKINRSSSVHSDVIAVIDQLSDEEWIVVTHGMQDMTRQDFIEVCLGIISQLWKATFQKFVPVVVQILDYDTTSSVDSEGSHDASGATESQGFTFKGPADAPFVRTLRGQIRQEVKKALIYTVERISRSSLSTRTLSNGPGADCKTPANHLEEETLKVLTKRLHARNWAARGLPDEEVLSNSKTRGITKKVVIAVLTVIQSSCLHGAHPEATAMLLRAIAKKIKSLASLKNKRQVSFSLGSYSLKKVPPFLLTADFKTKASKTVMLVLLRHMKCPLVGCAAKQPSLVQEEQMAPTVKCGILPYFITADSLITDMVDTVLEILVAVSEISEGNITSSSTNMFAKVQQKVKQFVVFHKEIGVIGVTKGSGCGGSQTFKQAAVNMESEMNLATIECVDDVMANLNEVGAGRSSSPEQFWCKKIAKDITPTPDDSLATWSTTKSQSILPEKVSGISCIASSTGKTVPKRSAKDLKLKISAAVEAPQQRHLSEESCTSEGLDKEATGQMKRISRRLRHTPKKPSKDFHLTVLGSDSASTSYKQSSSENTTTTETCCDKMVDDCNNTSPQTKCVKPALRIHEAILKEDSHSIVKNLVSDVMDSVLLQKDIALPCSCASAVEAIPISPRIAEPDTRMGRVVVTAWPASQRKEAWAAQTPCAKTKTKKGDKMDQAAARLENLISSGGLEMFAIDLTNQLCHLLKKSTCQRCHSRLSNTDLPSMQRQNDETACSSDSLKDAYKFVEKSVKHLLHQMLYPSYPIQAGDPDDFIQGDTASASQTLNEMADLVRDRVMKELMKVFSQITKTQALLPCSSEGSHFAEVEAKAKVAGTGSMASKEVEHPMSCKGRSNKVATHQNSPIEVKDGLDTNPCTGKKRKKIKKNKKQNAQLTVSQRNAIKRLRKRNAVLPVLLTLDTNAPEINSQEGHLQKNPVSVSAAGNTNKNNNRSLCILSDVYIQGQGHAPEDSTSQLIDHAFEEKPKKRNIFARIFSSVSKSVRKCLKRCRRV